jgi:molybdopterin synthase subunit MoaE
MTRGVRGSAVRDHALDVAAVSASVEDQRCGAVVSFVGVVRNHDRGRQVVSIEYEGHPTAPEVLRRVAEEVATAHPGCCVAIEHRVGTLQVGDVALVAAVSAAHRSAAFLATSELVDLVKERLPVWKRQVFDDGTDEWTGAA